MKKLNFKHIFPLVVFVVSLLLIMASLLLKIEEKKKKELIYKEILRIQEVQKENERKAEEKIYLLGKFNPEQKKEFVLVPAKYNLSGHKIYLRQETLAAFENMAKAANEDDIQLNIVSATRNFDYQKDLWNKKWEGVTLVEGKSLLKSIPNELERFKKILEYSATPGTSRHHWGTDIDIDSAIPEYFNTEKGRKVYEWLDKFAMSFGFCQIYNQKGQVRSTGYNEEKWHWSYKPLSKTFTQEYKSLVTNDDIKGFDGDEYVPSFNLIDDYVLSINPECI